MSRTMNEPHAAEQSIEELQERYRALDRQKTEAEVHLRTARARLEELRQEAREKYGTDDVAELREKLERMTAENDQKRRAYQAELDRIESDLEMVEEKFSESETLEEESS